MAHERLYFIVNTFNVSLKNTALRAFIMTEMTLMRLDLVMNTVYMSLKITAT